MLDQLARRRVTKQELLIESEVNRRLLQMKLAPLREAAGWVEAGMTAIHLFRRSGPGKGRNEFLLRGTWAALLGDLLQLWRGRK